MKMQSIFIKNQIPECLCDQTIQYRFTMIQSIEERKMRDCKGESPCVYCVVDIPNKKYYCTDKFSDEWEITNGRLQSETCEEHITNEELHELVISGVV